MSPDSHTVSWRRPLPPVHTAIGLLMAALSGTSHGVGIDTGNPDLEMSFNNTLRYNWARRMQDIDPHVALAGPPAGATYSGYASSDNLFKKGSTITNRLDLLSEFNLNYAGKYGLRVSAAAWYDKAYAGKHPTPDPTQAGRTTPYVNNEFTPYVKRYYAGLSGEFLDAYVFGNFELGDGGNVNVRAGKHAVVWGEGLFGSNHSIAYSQATSDSLKQVASPGASAKETALPTQQISATAVVNDEITLLTHYQFDWVPNRLPEGGTYFAAADVILRGPNINRDVRFQEGSKGAFGVGLKWSPAWLDGTLGAYYRKFDDKGGGWAAQPTVGFGTTAVWAKDIELYGVSLSKSVAGLSIGAELSLRRNDALTSSTTASAGATGRYEGARGDTWHAVLNGIKSFGPSPVFDSATLTGELAWSRLDKITRNSTLYRAAGYVAVCSTATAEIRGCIDKDYVSVSLAFTPVWLQALPGVDLALPIFYSKNIGNSPSAGGGSDGFTTYKIGLSTTVRSAHIVDVSYTWWDQKIDTATPFAGGVYGRLLGAPYSDKGFLSLTYQYAF